MNRVFELCPRCGNEVELSAEMVIQPCPNCNAYIVPCSLCDCNNTQCSNCELAMMCDEKNAPQSF